MNAAPYDGRLTMLHPEPFSSDALIQLAGTERTDFEELVPPEHFLRRLLQAVDFESFRPLLSSGYSREQGRPPLDPVVVFKLEVLARHYKLSDREVMMAVGLE